MMLRVQVCTEAGGREVYGNWLAGSDAEPIPVGQIACRCENHTLSLRRLSLGPSKGVLEGVLLTPHQAAEVDQLILERGLVFGLQIPAVERRVIRAEAVVDPCLVELPRHLAHGARSVKVPVCR